jgi:hypothetical protein
MRRGLEQAMCHRVNGQDRPYHTINRDSCLNKHGPTIAGPCFHVNPSNFIDAGAANVR